MPLKKNAQQGKHKLSERRDDFYATPPEAVEALLRAENIPHHIWEPCCGDGQIVKVLRWHGHTVFASNLIDYGCPQSLSGIDFLMERKPLALNVEAVITNPPYALAQEFISHALNLVPKVYMLLRLAFLESEKRSNILDSGQLAKVLVFKSRLPMMHRAGWAGPRASSSIPFAWFCFDNDYRGDTTLRRISWKA